MNIHMIYLIFQKLSVDLEDDCDDGVKKQDIGCEVLDCDSISQVKQKCVYQIYKNQPASIMPKADDLKLGKATKG